MDVDSNYRIYIFNTHDWGGANIDTLILPMIYPNGIFNFNDQVAFVNENSISKSPDHSYRDPAFRSILNETEGESFWFEGHSSSFSIGKTIKVDTTIWVQNVRYDSVLVTIHYEYGCSVHGYSVEECANLIEYYAKGVGLIRRDVGFNYYSDNWETVLELVEYSINR